MVLPQTFPGAGVPARRYLCEVPDQARIPANDRPRLLARPLLITIASP
jgi:hypothetical protein